ncbi:MAG: hypothetical protein K0S65_4451, partial [Labilithrix sp.]|nr:hypothetical protein [Labilithrix sp.]
AWMATTAALFLFAPRTAHAESTAFELAWSAPPECPSGKEIVDATRARLGASRSDEPPALLVQGTVTPEDGGFLVALAMKDTSGNPVGRRQVRVEGPTCSAVADATALVLAMIIAARPRGASPAVPLPDAPPPSVPVDSDSPAPPPPPPRRPEAAPLPPPPRRLVVGAAALVSRGVLPSMGAGLALRATYAPVPLFLLGIETSFEAGGSVEDATSEVRFMFAGGSALAGIQVVRGARVEIILTLNARAGVIRTSGTGFRSMQDGMRAIALAGPGVLLRAKLASSWFVEALPQAEAVLVRDRFHIRDGETVYPIHRPAPVAGRFSLGIAYEFR